MSLEIISQKDFTEVINIMAEVFPNINAKARIKYYYNAVKNLPFKALKDISQEFLMASKFMPLPVDFSEAAHAWKKKNNWYAQEIIEVVAICVYYRNSGVVRIKHHSNSDVDQLMTCNCSDSWRAEHFKFPKFDYSLKQVYKVEPCPLEWFKPSDKNPEGKEFEKLKDAYLVRIKKAEKYWSDLGYKH